MRTALLFGFVMCVLPLGAAPLEFDALLKEAHLAADANMVTMDFHFENKSGKEVVIKRSAVTCSCMHLGIEGGKMNYEPGGKGTIRVTYDMKAIIGVVDKAAMIYIDDDPDEEPSIVLTTRIHIPVLIEVDPKTVKWQLGEAPVEKIMTITMKHKEPIRVLRVAGVADRIRHELRTVEEGKVYQLVLTPIDTKEPSLSVFRIETDCAIEKHRVQQAFAVVRR